MPRSALSITDYYPPTSVNQPHSSYWLSYLMTFFQGWPVHQTFSGYCFSICLIFLLGVAVEICSVLKSKQPQCGVFKAYIGDFWIHGIRMFLAYLIIVSVVSTDYSILVAAVVGHAIGNLLVNVYKYYSNEAIDIIVTCDSDDAKGWPNNHLGMYILALAFVFLIAVLVEMLSASASIKATENRPFLGGLIQASVHAVRMALSYIVMLSVMSFNIGVLIAAVIGHFSGCFIVKFREYRRASGSGNSKV